MVKRLICVLIIFLSMESCFNYYYIKEDEDKERILNPGLFSFNQKMSLENSKIIDTTCLYLQLLPYNSSISEKENSGIMIFHNDGTYESRSKKYFNISYKKSSVYYGGKFILDGNTLEIQSFYPSSGGKTNYFDRVICQGKINNDTVVIKIFNHNRVFLKKRYEDVFGK